MLSQTSAVAPHTPAEIAAADRARALAGRVPPAPVSPLIVVAAGGGVGLVGLAYQFFVFKPARDALVAAPNDVKYANIYPAFRDDRIASVGIYGAAAATIAIGAVLYYKAAKRRHRPATISAAIAPRAAMVIWEWQR